MKNTIKPSQDKTVGKCKHDFQLLSYGSKAGYVGTLTDMMVLMVCRDCEKVVEKTVKSK